MAATKTPQVKVLRWTIGKAALEWGMSKDVLSKRIHSLSIEPGTDNMYGTKQICTAIYGDKQAEQVRLVRENADAKAIENALARKEICKVDNVIDYMKGVCLSIRQLIEASPNLTPEEKDDLFKEIQEVFTSGTITDKICPPES